MPAITKPSDHFNIVTWTGTSTSSARSITGVGFKPDLVWEKPRSVSYTHSLSDSVRGANIRLCSNNTDAEATNFLYGYTSSFDSDGFTATPGSSSNENWNATGETYVAWTWKGSNAAAVTNTSGTISSQVSANPTAGFSIVSWTGNGSTSATVGHGLGAVPAMIICKERSGTDYWHVKHKSTSTNTNLFLNVLLASTSAASVGDGVLADLSSNTTFGFATAGSPGNVVAVNENGVTNIAYCWSEIPGYSAFGSYTGNGSADGPFVYLGFKPKFVMVKGTDTTSNWNILDSSRDPYNVESASLRPNSSATETNTPSGTYAICWDALSNGFKFRGGSGTNDVNQTSANYVYAAFAENPFKFSNAK